MDSQTGDRISFNLSENRNALPQSLLHTVCSKLYVELLKTTTPEQGQHGEEDIAEKKQAANHAVFKIIFADKCGDYKGIRLEVHVSLEYQSEEESIDGRQVIFQYGEFIASPSLSSNPSSNSLWTCSLPIHPWNVGDVLRLLFHYDASEFQFVCIDNKYFGCRDWITQVIYLMDQCSFIQSTDISEVLTGPNLSVRSIYEALGFRLDYRGRISASPIDKGRFTCWRRYQSPLMPYHGSQKALELAELWAPSSLYVSHGQNPNEDIGQ